MMRIFHLNRTFFLKSKKITSCFSPVNVGKKYLTHLYKLWHHCGQLMIINYLLCLRPFLVNELEPQYLLHDRRKVYEVCISSWLFLPLRGSGKVYEFFFCFFDKENSVANLFCLDLWLDWQYFETKFSSPKYVQRFKRNVLSSIHYKSQCVCWYC